MLTVNEREEVDTFRLLPIYGSAVVTIVASKNCINKLDAINSATLI